VRTRAIVVMHMATSPPTWARSRSAPLRDLDSMPAGSLSRALDFRDDDLSRPVVVGYQHQVAGMVVAPMAVWGGTAVRAGASDPGSPVGNRVVERLQPLERCPLGDHRSRPQRPAHVHGQSPLAAHDRTGSGAACR
jgi:hypothetical protein